MQYAENRVTRQSTKEAFRATGALPLLFIPEGRTYSPPAKQAVVLPAATVRSARRMRLLREPNVQCHITSVLLSLATQSADCFASQQNKVQNKNVLHPRRLPA